MIQSGKCPAYALTTQSLDKAKPPAGKPVKSQADTPLTQAHWQTCYRPLESHDRPPYCQLPQSNDCRGDSSCKAVAIRNGSRGDVVVRRATIEMNDFERINPERLRLAACNHPLTSRRMIEGISLMYLHGTCDGN